MAKKKEPDRLSLEASAAIAAGMSYGKWKAMQKPDEQEPIVKVEGIQKHCAYCGKEFYTKNKQKIYCDELCKNAVQLRKDKAKRELSKMLRNNQRT